MADPSRLQKTLEKWVFNPPVRALLALGIGPRFFALLETTGRRSGKRRRTPVGGGLSGDGFWLVSEAGDRAGYVRNLLADPRVRVKVGRQWRSGTAAVMADDDGWARRRELDRAGGLVGRIDGLVFRVSTRRAGGTPLTVRVDLDSDGPA